MLQQTQVKSVIPYFERWINRFPDVETLAHADLDSVLKSWEGLGYYTRARNIHKTAQIIFSDLNNVFPNNYDELKKLPGIGPYTASAISSMAFKEIRPVVDGNVIRVMSRLLADDTSTKNQATRKYDEMLQGIIPADAPGDFNQAMMDLGRMVCKPRSPLCQECPLKNLCRAHSQGEVELYPVKEAKKQIPSYNIVVGLVMNYDKVLIYQRPLERLLGGLWEFPGGRIKEGLSIEESLEVSILEKTGCEVSVGEKLAQINHVYSHFKIKLIAYACHLKQASAKPLKSRAKWATLKSFNDYAFHTSNKKLIPYIEKVFL